MVSARTPYIAHPQEVDVNPTTDLTLTEDLVTIMTERMATLTRTLSEWMQEQPHTLAEVEQHVVRLFKELAATLVAGLCTLVAPDQPTSTITCACGQQAAYQPERKAHLT